jgi:hypothetical protein
VKRNGLLIVSTCVVETEGFWMVFNDEGRLQTETNTFWYFSPSLLDYVLRYLKLAPVDCLYVRYEPLERFDQHVGYASVLCRAVDEVLPTPGDSWMVDSARQSWEHNWLVDWKRAAHQPLSTIRQSSAPPSEFRREDLPELVDVARIIRDRSRVAVEEPSDSHLLQLADRA